MSQGGVARAPKRPLNPSFLNLKNEELQYFKEVIGIQDDEELKNHILQVQAKAYQVDDYGCICTFAFMNLKISALPVYKQVLEIPQSRPEAILLDIGSFFGTDLRKAVFDGWPVETAIASDLHPEFWDFGHELYRTTPETFPAAFIPGDSFSSTLIEPREPFYSDPPTDRPTDLRTLQSLTPLQGYISAIHTSFFFHLFDEEQQLVLAKQLATLLSPQPGSVIFGIHRGRAVKGWTNTTSFRSGKVFCHSPESWISIWDNGIFKKGSVRVDAQIEERGASATDPTTRITHWNEIEWIELILLENNYLSGSIGILWAADEARLMAEVRDEIH